MLEFNATFILVVISFVIFMLFMKSLYFDPVGRIKQTRISRIEADQQSAAAYLADYDQLRQKYELGLSAARKEAQQIIQNLRRNAKQSAGEMIAAAKTEAGAHLEKEISELHRAQEAAYLEVSSQKSELVRLIIQKVTSDTAMIGV